MMDEFTHLKQHVQQQKNIVSVTPAPKDDNPSTDDIMKKLDHFTREATMAQKLICSKLDKLESLMQSKHLDSNVAESKPVASRRPSVVPDLDQRFDKVKESIMKRRVSISKRRESFFKPGESILLPQIQRMLTPGSPKESPAASPRSAGPESFPEADSAGPVLLPESVLESRSAVPESFPDNGEGSDAEPISRQVSKASTPKSKQSPRRADAIASLGTEPWPTWTSDTAQSSSLLTPKLSAIPGKISSRWTSLVSSYAVTEAENSLGRSDSVVQMVSQRTSKQSRMAFTAWNFLDNPDSSRSAKLYDTMEPYFLILGTLFSLLQTLPDTSSFWLNGLACKAIDFFIDSFIMADLLIRYAVSPSRGFAFFKEWLNVVDMLAACPLIVRIFLVVVAQDPSNEPLLFCIVAIARLLKMMRRFQKIHLLLGAFELALEAMPVLCYVLALLTLTFSTAVYLVEPRDTFDTLPRSIYFTLVTATSLGYGDYSPTTTSGQFIVSALTICSAAYMAMPLGIIGSAFTSVWQDRDRILLMKKTRQAMHTWGFTAEDIPMLFAFFDSKGLGALSLHDFREMIVTMRIGLSDKRVRELFKSFDTSGSGTVDDKEFVRQIFPQEFFDVFTVSENESICASPRGRKRASSETSAPESANRAGSPVSSNPGSPRSSSPSRSLSVPMRSASGRSYPLSFALNSPWPNADQQKQESEPLEASGTLPPRRVVQSKSH